MKYSTNNRAKEIVWLRNVSPNAIAIDLPIELWYKCPVCKIESEDLLWSEYNGFLWCEKCDKDFPSCLCMPDIDNAINIYLNCVQEWITISQNVLERTVN